MNRAWRKFARKLGRAMIARARALEAHIEACADCQAAPTGMLCPEGERLDWRRREGVQMYLRLLQAMCK